MKPYPFLSPLLALALAACGGAAAVDQTAALVDPASFVPGVNHPYFPIEPGRVWVYEGQEDGIPKREEVRSLESPRVILRVPCTAIREDIFLDGVLTAVTTEWFAQDTAGNVWKFGEESLELDGAAFTRTPDSWVAGVAGARAWLAFPADPQVGSRYSGHRPGGQDVLEVLSVTETAVVPAGTFAGCLQMLENPEDPADSDIILYAGGVGRVAETNASGHVDLVSVWGD